MGCGRANPSNVVRTRNGLIEIVGVALVKTGAIHATQGRALGLVQKPRRLADYTADPAGVPR